MAAVIQNALKAELFEMENIFKSKSSIAKILDLDRSSIIKWDKGAIPDATNQARVAGLYYIMKKLRSRFDEETTMLWLSGNNAHLGYKKPADLIKKNRIAEVLNAIEQMELGTYI